MGGFISGMNSFQHGFLEGFKGLFSLPIQGFKENPREGGLGILRGITGLIIKPITGVIDLISETFHGIEEELSVPINRKRLNYPRLNIYSSYNEDEKLIYM